MWERARSFWMREEEMERSTSVHHLVCCSCSSTSSTLTNSRLCCACCCKSPVASLASKSMIWDANSFTSWSCPSAKAMTGRSVSPGSTRLALMYAVPKCLTRDRHCKRGASRMSTAGSSLFSTSSPSSISAHFCRNHRTRGNISALRTVAPPFHVFSTAKGSSSRSCGSSSSTSASPNSPCPAPCALPSAVPPASLPSASSFPSARLSKRNSSGLSAEVGEGELLTALLRLLLLLLLLVPVLKLSVRPGFRYTISLPRLWSRFSFRDLLLTCCVFLLLKALKKAEALLLRPRFSSNKAGALRRPCSSSSITPISAAVSCFWGRLYSRSLSHSGVAGNANKGCNSSQQ
mmetsp:Transcript_32043/g.62659  ORF Transcript_32043/g.62659 Transcript_32043/m.62659 type:complete len:347 (-) Transcript_32043:1158-2198(-)